MFTFSTLVLLTIVSVTGCGSGVRFGGVVQFEDGTPVQNATVSFIDTKTQYDGQTNAQGKYTLYGATLKEGVPPGQYKVAVSMPNNDDGTTMLPTKYASIETSGLNCNVQSGGTFDIIIEKEKK
ncbi:MAG: carboxypeptidase-like regulatory domain-containing protein [Planctomycetaceae bacterium]|nr:carboxypeptidase-like regulatory domain-containing protein [Planctomycetaceae bacterium]